MIGQVIRPSVQVTGQMHLANSVDPKPLWHGNPELNSTQVDKGVQSRYEASKLDEGVLGALWKHSEMHRNDAFSYPKGYVVTNLLRNAHDGGRNRHDLISGCKRHCNFSVYQHHRLVEHRGNAHM